jgi:hypothetical protein
MILLDETKLNLLLETKKRFIGKTVMWDSVLSAVSFLVSVFLASYRDILGIHGIYFKCVFVMIGIFFTGKSIHDVYNSLKNTYTAEDLFNDINKLNQITHNHSIIVIKDSFSKYPNRFLLYFDPRWSCDLFLNFKENINNENFIISSISNRLKIDVADISISYIAQNIHEKYSVSHDENRVYCHRLYLVSIKNFPSNMKKGTFKVDGISYKWMSLSEMEENPRIMEVNSDIVQFVKNNCS